MRPTLTESRRVFISTGGSKSDSAVEVGRSLLQACPHGIELTAGQSTSDPTSEVSKLAQQRRVLLHNYFPPPTEAFVLNVSEPDPLVYERSQRLVCQALEISGLCGATHYGVHAGFLAQPNANELGRTIPRREVLDRALGLELMVDRLLELSKVADTHGVRLLVENHALSAANMESFGENFLLLVDPEEILAVLAALKGRVGLLLDVGHLNVSTKTLGLDRLRALQQLEHLAEGYHLSSNNGFSDEHSALTGDEWFWPYLDRDSAFYTVEIHAPDAQQWIDSADRVSNWLDDPKGLNAADFT